jgi:hypothetical protein
LNVTAPYEPPATLRAFISAVAVAPEAIARPLTLAGEIMGTLLFVNMLESARRHLAHDPELRDAFEERIVDVLIDEIGHISYNRMHMSTICLAQTRALVPFVVGGLSSAAPELVRLGLLPRHPCRSIVALLREPAQLPECVRKQAFFA